MYIKDRKYTTAQAQLIGKSLGYRDRKHIRETLGCHRNHIYRVLRGDYYDERVMDEAMNILRTRAKLNAEKNGRLEQALQSLHELELLSA